jgi:hypothetical protein
MIKRESELHSLVLLYTPRLKHQPFIPQNKISNIDQVKGAIIWAKDEIDLCIIKGKQGAPKTEGASTGRHNHGRLFETEIWVKA